MRIPERESAHLKGAEKRLLKTVFASVEEYEKRFLITKDHYRKYKLLEHAKSLLREELKKITERVEEKLAELENMERKILSAYIEDIKRRGPAFIKLYIRKMDDERLGQSLKRYLSTVMEKTLESAIDGGAISWNRKLTPDKGYGAGLDERVVEFPLVLEMGRFSTEDTVLDAGASLNARIIRKYVHRTGAHIVHFTQSAREEELIPHDDRASYMFGDLRSMPFKDETFDKVVCISTLEHIGMDNSRYGGKVENNPDSYIDAVREMFRVLKRGGRMLITVPYGTQKNLGWFRIFNHSHIKKMLKVCNGCKHKEKYFYYNGYWYEGTKVPPHEKRPPKWQDITGVAILLVEKTKTRRDR